MDVFAPILFLFAPGHPEEEVRVETLDPVDSDGGNGGTNGSCIIA